jgi:hypothetical protein
MVQIRNIYNYLYSVGKVFDYYDSEDTLNNINDYIYNNEPYDEWDRMDVIMVCMNEGCSEEDFACFIWDGNGVIYPYYNGRTGSSLDNSVDSTGYFPNNFDVLDIGIENIKSFFGENSSYKLFENCVGWTNLDSYSYGVNVSVQSLVSECYSQEHLVVCYLDELDTFVYMISDGDEDCQVDKLTNYLRSNRPYIFREDMESRYGIQNNLYYIRENLGVYDSSNSHHLIIDPYFIDLEYDDIYYNDYDNSPMLSKRTKKRTTRQNYVESYNNTSSRSNTYSEPCSATTKKGSCCHNKAVKNGLCQMHYNNIRKKSRVY